MSTRIEPSEAVAIARKQLAEWLLLPITAVRTDVTNDDGLPQRPDALLRTPNGAFLIEVKSEGSLARVRQAIEQFMHFTKRAPHQVPLLVVPYMAEGGRSLCAEEGISWMDLSGNADIRATGLRVLISGKTNRFKPMGRPSSVFAPKSARIARFLLRVGTPGAHFGQAALAGLADVDEGMTSRIIQRMRELDLVRKDSVGMIVVPDRNRLLDAWQDEADLTKNTIIKGHIPARSPEDAMERLSTALQSRQMAYAFTGLSAAWLYDHFAMHRLTSVYVQKAPTADTLAYLGFKEESRGANTWLIIPKDSGVFQGVQTVKGYPCVQPTQTYIDLKDHPERSSEAAEHLRETHLKF